MRLRRSWFHYDHASSDIFSLHASQQEARVVTSARLVARFLEGFDIRDFRLDRGSADFPYKLDFTVLLQCPSFYTAAGDCTPTRDGEDIFDGHEEGFIGFALRCRDPSVYGIEQFVDLLDADLRLAVLEGAEGGAEDDGGFVAFEAVVGEGFAHFHFDELEHLLVFHGVDFVDEDNDLLDADLAGEKKMFTGLGPGRDCVNICSE